MEAKNKWQRVVWAGVFAVAVIGLSLISYAFEHSKKNSDVAVSQTPNTVSPSQKSPSNTEPLTSVISNDLLASYANLAGDGVVTPAERDQMLADLVKKHVANQKIVPNISLTDLNVSDTVTLDSYTKLLAIVLGQGLRVKNYELGVFTKTVTAGNTNGTPELQEDADLYTRIAAALLAMEVPKALAPQHLEAVKSIGALAKAVGNMSEWQGDSIEALQESDTFNKAEGYVQSSVGNLTDALDALKQKS